jgi:ubiquinol-cytochrome c reductase iron-sulfur subunit
MAKQRVDQDKRRFLIAATTAVGGVAVAAVSVPFVKSMLPSERAKAAGAPVEVDISKIKPGEMITQEWRGKPVWIISLTKEMSEKLAGHNDKLSDPMLDVTTQQPEYCKNATRSIRPNLVVMIGICTHLGCSPTAKLQSDGDMGADWSGGFFCPCHGSKFDLAGRVFKGSPAPTNLVVPPHKYLSDTVLLIGEDGKSEA